VGGSRQPAAAGRAAARSARAALDVADPKLPADERRKLERARADALMLSGRSYEAAQVYRGAAESAPPDEAADLRRRAADNLLRAGHIVEGLAAVQAVMRDLGVSVAPTRARALASLMIQRVRIALRGLGYTRRQASEVPARELERLDSMYAASTALGMIDHMRGAELAARSLQAALDAGEERAACRALAIEAVFRASFGGRQMKKAEAISRDVELKARQLGDDTLIGFAQLAIGATFTFSGRYRPAAQAFADAERAFSTGVGVDWEKITARYFYVTALIATGDFQGAAESTARFVEEAERRNDLYARNLFKTQPVVWSLLREDHVDDAEREVAGALDGWPRDTFFTAHYFELLGRVIVHHYRGESRRALDEAVAALPGVRSAQLHRVPWAVVDLHRHMLSAAFAVGDDKWTARLISWIEPLRTPVSDAFVLYYRGASAERRGDHSNAQRMIMQAVRLFGESDLAGMAAAARFRLGQLMEGVEGKRLCAEARAWMKTQGVRNPERMINLLAPAAARAST
jgi:tetratricopeptide (TPR) repeat protein